MDFAELKQKINALQTHDLTPTNAEDVSLDPEGWVCIAFDESDTESELEDALEQVKDLTKEVAELETECDDLVKRVVANADLLDEIKSEDGKKLLDYVKEAEEALERAKGWREHATKCETEVTALRKRKGMDAAYMLYRREIMQLLHYLEHEKEPRSCALLKKMRTHK